jgi:hypothetical protein
MRLPGEIATAKCHLKTGHSEPAVTAYEQKSLPFFFFVSLTFSFSGFLCSLSVSFASFSRVILCQKAHGISTAAALASLKALSQIIT